MTLVNQMRGWWLRSSEKNKGTGREAERFKIIMGSTLNSHHLWSDYHDPETTPALFLFAH